MIMLNLAFNAPTETQWKPSPSLGGRLDGGRLEQVHAMKLRSETPTPPSP